jgi:hypothetical protein
MYASLKNFDSLSQTALLEPECNGAHSTSSAFCSKRQRVHRHAQLVLRAPMLTALRQAKCGIEPFQSLFLVGLVKSTMWGKMAV